MVHGRRLVVLGWQSQFPFAKIFLVVGVREFVPSICGQRQSKISVISVNADILANLKKTSQAQQAAVS